MERVSASAVNSFPQVDFTSEEIITLNVICEEQHYFFICLERVCNLIRHWLSRLQRTALKLTTETNFCFTSQEHLSPWHRFNSVVKQQHPEPLNHGKLKIRLMYTETYTWNSFWWMKIKNKHFLVLHPILTSSAILRTIQLKKAPARLFVCSKQNNTWVNSIKQQYCDNQSFLRTPIVTWVDDSYSPFITRQTVTKKPGSL